MDATSQAQGHLVREVGNILSRDTLADIEFHVTFHDETLDLYFTSENLPVEFVTRDIVVYLPQLAGEGGVVPVLLREVFSQSPLCYQVESMSLTEDTIPLYNLHRWVPAPRETVSTLLDDAEGKIVDKEIAWNLVQRHLGNDWRGPLAFSGKLASGSVAQTLKDALSECALATLNRG